MDNVKIEDVQNMTPEELKELKMFLGKKLLKRAALIAGIAVASVVTLSVISKQLNNSDDETLEITE